MPGGPGSDPAEQVGRRRDATAYSGAVGGLAVVTGGSRGIGAATAVELARRDWDVAVGYLRDDEAAASVVTACRRHGARAQAVPVDVSSEDSVQRYFAAVDDELGRPAALVNCAGVVGPRARLDEFTADRVAHILAVNVLGSILCSREAIRRMSTRHGGPGGVIINLSSAAARLGSPGEYVDYAASKGAVDTLTLGLAREVGAEAIRVNAVRPGLIRTDIHAHGGQPDRLERLAPLIPVGRVGEVHEVAATIAWLCSDEASYVTGALIDVSGGR